MRIANAVVGYATYVRRAIWPTGPVAMYPLAPSPSDLPSVGGMPSEPTAPGLEFGAFMTVAEAFRRLIATRESQRRPVTIAESMLASALASDPSFAPAQAARQRILADRAAASATVPGP